MIGILAAETVTSPSFWQQVAAVAAAVTAVIVLVATTLKYVPGVKGWWDRRQKTKRLERVGALAAILEVVVPPIVERAVEAPIAEVRAQVVEGHERTRISEEKVRAELVAHTTQERQLVRTVMETAVRIKAVRQSDVDEIRRAMDADEVSWEQARGEIPPGV